MANKVSYEEMKKNKSLKEMFEEHDKQEGEEDEKKTNHTV